MIIRCPLYSDENLIHNEAVEVAARLLVKDLEEKNPELLQKIDINKFLPALKKKNNSIQQPPASITLDINQLLATVTGQDVEDINNLRNLSKYVPNN